MLEQQLTNQYITPSNGGRSMSLEEKVEHLLRMNREHSEHFCNARLSRRQYRAKHPTEVGAFKCMDGRIHIPIATNTPLGIIQPWRNIGGKFDLGWPYFGKDVSNWVDYAVSQGRDVLILVTYHFSQGDEHRGCAGHSYNKESSISAALNLKKQVEAVFGRDHHVVYPILFGFETDYDSAILHGENGEVVNLANVEDTSEDYLIKMLHRLYPDMKKRILLDLLPLVIGNINHIVEVRESKRPLTEVVHREWVIGVGKGFDWLHEPNMAILVGPFSPNLEVPIATAASIIKANMEAGRIDNNGFVLLSSAIYRESVGTEPLLAKQKALFLKQFALDTIREKHPALAELMKPIAVVVDMNTREMKIVS